MSDTEPRIKIESAISNCKRLFDKKLRESHRCKLYDFLPVINAADVYSWSEEPLVALFQKQFIIQASLIELQEDYRLINAQSSEFKVSDEDRKIIDISPVYVSMYELHFNETDGYMLELENNAAEIVLQHYRDYDRFFSATSENVAALLELFWAEFKGFDQRQEAYSVLGLAPDSSWEMVQKAYRSLVSQHHPDRGGDNREFVRVREAFEILKKTRYSD